MVYIVIILLIISVLTLISFGKKAKIYNLRKEYSYCYKLVLTDAKKANGRLEKTIEKCKEYKNREYICKFAVLKLYTDIDCRKDVESTIQLLNIEDLFCKNGKYSASKAILNMDSLYFMSVVMLKANKYKLNNVIDYLWKHVNKYCNYLEENVEFCLFKAIYSSVTDKDDKGKAFYNEILMNGDVNDNNDNKTMEIYQNTALLMKKYLCIELSNEEKNKVNEFSKTLLGKIVSSNL